MDFVTIASFAGLVVTVFWITNLFNKGKSSQVMVEATDYFVDQIKTAKAEKLAESQELLKTLEVKIEDLVVYKKELHKL